MGIQPSPNSWSPTLFLSYPSQKDCSLTCTKSVSTKALALESTMGQKLCLSCEHWRNGGGKKQDDSSQLKGSSSETATVLRNGQEYMRSHGWDRKLGGGLVWQNFNCFPTASSVTRKMAEESCDEPVKNWRWVCKGTWTHKVELRRRWPFWRQYIITWSR